MASSTGIKDLTPASEHASADVAITEVHHPSMTAEVHPSMVASIREQCSACGAAMASDQRYCVDCGERRGSARVPLMDSLAQRARETPTARPPSRRPRMSVNSTLIAGVGTLLLAMGIGVLIGRSGNNTSAKSPPVQVVTVAGAGGAASGGTASGGAAGGGSAPSATAAKSGETKTTASAPLTAKSKPKKSTVAPPKVVKVGSPGKGPGYQKGKFTGNFFGEGEK